MPPPLQPFACVRVVKIRENRFAGERIFYRRQPQVGDIATVVEIFTSPELAYEVECSDQVTGETLWLDAMYPDELEEWPGS